MSFFKRKESGGMDLAVRAKEVFGVTAYGGVDGLPSRCAAVYQGRPDWIDPEDGIGTVNLAKSVCSEVARLACLAIHISVSGGERGQWLQEQIDRVYFQLRHWVELGCAWGTVILKPNGEDIEPVTPDRFVITEVRGDDVLGAVFESRAYDGESERYYTRLEYHRFLRDGRYAVSNRCFVGCSAQDRGKAVPVEATPWAGLSEDMTATGVDRPLFGVLRMPGIDPVRPQSPLGLPVFADALRELRDLDVAYSRNAGEILDSQRICLLDDRLTEQAGRPVGRGREMKLPRFVRQVFGGGPEEYYQAIDPALNTETRLAGINALLSQIGFKCGFSNGYFVFNERSGMVTATQVEADDRRTIQLVKDVRDKLECALDGLIYALDRFADGYMLAPAGAYETVYDFGDITYNREEDRVRWYGYVSDGKVPFWYYLVKFEGLTEDEAKMLSGGARV